MTEQKRVFSFRVDRAAAHVYADNSFVVYREQSPFFCLVGDTEKNAILRAEAAIEFYVKCKLEES